MPQKKSNPWQLWLLSYDAVWYHHRNCIIHYDWVYDRVMNRGLIMTVLPRPDERVDDAQVTEFKGRAVQGFVSVDEHGWMHLGDAGKTYSVTENPDGTLTLIPGEFVSDLERRIMGNPELRAKLEYSLAHREEGVPRERRPVNS